MTENSVQQCPPEYFLPSEVDRSWTAVHLSDAALASQFVVEFLVSFYSSERTQSRVSYVWDYTANNAHILSTITTMPASNLAYVTGPTNIIVVLADQVSSSSGNTISAKDLRVPIYKSSQQQRPVWGYI